MPRLDSCAFAKDHPTKIVKYAVALPLIAVIVLAASVPLARMEQPGDLLPAEHVQPLAIDNVYLVTMVDEQAFVDELPLEYLNPILKGHCPLNY